MCIRDSLEPHFDARTMEIHHSKHHQGYTNKLNAAIEGTNQESKNIHQILTDLDMNNMALRNNAGGYFNHKLFWEVMNPNNKTKRLINEKPKKKSEIINVRNYKTNIEVFLSNGDVLTISNKELTNITNLDIGKIDDISFEKQNIIIYAKNKKTLIF